MNFQCKNLYRILQISFKYMHRKKPGDFPGGPLVKTLPSYATDEGLIPVWGAKIPYALWPKNQHINQKQYCN